MWVWWTVFVAQLACVGVPGCALRALWLFGMITLARFMYWLCLKLDADVNIWNLLDLHQYMHMFEASWSQSSVTMKWSKSSKVHQHIITCLHHGKFAGAKVNFPSTHDGISINTCWNFQHYMSTACDACVNVDSNKVWWNFQYYMFRTWTLWLFTNTLKHLRASSAGNLYNQQSRSWWSAFLTNLPRSASCQFGSTCVCFDWCCTFPEWTVWHSCCRFPSW